MKRTLLAATMALLLWGMPALGGPMPDSDGDGVKDVSDNCSDVSNPDQDDSDKDDCGNLCDADYDQNGQVDFGDFGAFANAFGKDGNPTQQHAEAISPALPRVVDFGDFGYFANAFGGAPGPSGTTSSTTACP